MDGLACWSLVALATRSGDEGETGCWVPVLVRLWYDLDSYPIAPRRHAQFHSSAPLEPTRLLHVLRTCLLVSSFGADSSRSLITLRVIRSLADA
jgi:hypothetical protein